MAIELMRSGAASATWMLPNSAGQQLNQTHFAQLPNSRLKQILTATYADAAAFAAAFGGAGGTCIATQYNMSDRPSSPPQYPTPFTPNGWQPFNVNFDVPGFEEKATITFYYFDSPGTSDERVSMTIMLGYSASK